MKKTTRKIIAARLARRVKSLLAKKDVTIVIVTGSVGKTSAKVAIGKVLSSHYQVQYSEDSYNTDIGIPLSIFGLKAPANLWDPAAWQRIFQKIKTISKHYPYDVVVLEMADDELDDMMKLLRFIKPKYGVITGVAPVHMERMIDMNNVLGDNIKIVSAAKKVIYNSDDSLLKKAFSKRKSALAYGTKNGALSFKNIKRNNKGKLEAELKIGNQKYPVKTKFISKEGLYGLLGAASVANSMSVPVNKITKSISELSPVKGRMNLLKGVNGSKIIDDSYNSSPEAVRAALQVLNEISARKKIAVLGNMNELGDYSQKAHRDIGKEAAKKSDVLVVIGKDAELHTAAAAKEYGMDPDNIKIFKTPYEAGHYLKRQIRKNDAVLVKGSQNGVFSEEVTRILLSPDLKPADVLVRQSSEWKRRKRRLFGL